MSRRVDYYDDPAAPPPNSLVPGGSALVADDQGRILLQRRADSGNWSLPGGTMDLGETLGGAETVVGLTHAFRPVVDKRGLYAPNPGGKSPLFQRATWCGWCRRAATAPQQRWRMRNV